MHSVDLSIYQSFIQLSPINHLLDNLLTNPSMYPPTYLSVHLFTHPPILHPPIKLTICPSTHPLSIHLSSCGSMYPSVQLSSHPSTQSSTTHLVYIYPSVQQSIHPSVCLPATHPISMVCRVSFMLMSHMGLQMHTRCTQSSDFQDIQ